jgi:hypothetical protein
VKPRIPRPAGLEGTTGDRPSMRTTCRAKFATEGRLEPAADRGFLQKTAVCADLRGGQYAPL